MSFFVPNITTRVLVATLLVAACTLAATGPALAQLADSPLPLCPADVNRPTDDATIRVAVLFKNTATGVRHADGIAAAVREHEMTDKLCFRLFPYISDQNGADILIELRANDEVDVILGPTDSGAFVAALEDASTQDANVPVISGLVTADAGNDADGWFFRVNVGVDRRATLMYDFLNKFWIRSIAVLYADSEFGRRAERAFARRLTDAQRQRYLPLVYETPPVPDDQLGEILRRRPEAIGFFGERQDIDLVYGRLQEMNADGTPYTPFMFTLMDARKIGGSVDDIYFASVAQGSGGQLPAAEELDEVFELGHDAALLVLNELQKQTVASIGGDTATRPDPHSAAWREGLRQRFVALLRNSVHQNRVRTGMSFTNFTNSVRPRIFHLSAGVAVPQDVARTVGWTEKLATKARAIAGSHGYWPAIAVTLILLLAALFSWIDLKTWFQGSRLTPFNRFFALFTAVRFLVVLALYLVLAETGAIRYDSILMVLIISLTPSALARTTFFETPQGRAIGLERLYQRALLWVEEQLMRKSHNALEARISTIAYYNSQDGMRRALLDIYRHHRSPVQRAQLVNDLEEQLRSEKDYFERRRICARRLLKHFDWERLEVEGLIPQNAVDSDEALPDPRVIVRLAARHIAQHPDKINKIHDLSKQELDRIRNFSPERAKELEDFLQWELAQAVAIEGELNVRLRFYYVLVSFDEGKLLASGFIDAQALEQYRESLAARAEQNGTRRARAWLWFSPKGWRNAT